MGSWGYLIFRRQTQAQECGHQLAIEALVVVVKLLC